MTKKPKRYWNFRGVTKIYQSLATEDERLFSIVEVYYGDGKPESYIETKRLMADMNSVDELKWTRKKIKEAFDKPILDLDHWPKEWVPTIVNFPVYDAKKAKKITREGRKNLKKAKKAYDQYISDNS
jgi:hypothetical protein